MGSKKQCVAGCLLAVLSLVLPMRATAAPLTLEESVQLALKGNEQIKAAASGVEVAKWKVEKAKGAQSLTLDVAHTSAKIGGEYWSVYHINDVPSNYFINSVSASLPLYTGGRLENAVKQAKIGQELSGLQLTGTEQDVQFQTTQLYYQILACRHFQQVREEAVKQLAEHLKNVQTQFDVGNVTKADVLRSEVELANAKQGLVTAENNTKQAIAAFNKVVGLPITAATEINDVFNYEQHAYKLEECFAYASQHRPDELAAQKAVEQAKLAIDIAQSGKKLGLSFDASYTTYDTAIDQFNTKQWMAGVTAHLNVLDGNVTRAGVKVAEQQLEQAKHQAAEVHNGVLLSVQNSFLDMQRAQRNMETMKVAVDKAKEDFSLAQARYGVNLGTNLDVMDAQVAFTAARTSYIQALYDYNVSKAALEKAVGKEVRQKLQ